MHQIKYFAPCFGRYYGTALSSYIIFSEVSLNFSLGPIDILQDNHRGCVTAINLSSLAVRISSKFPKGFHLSFPKTNTISGVK